MAQFQEVIDEVPEVAALRRRVDDGRRALLRDRRSGRRRRTRTRTSPTTRATSDLATVQDRVVRVEARRHRRRPRRTSSACSTRRSRPSAPAPRRSAGAARSLRDEALEYLVVVFTEDRSISRAGGVRLPRVDRRREVLARRPDQGRRELRRRRPSGSARTRRTGSSSRWIRTSIKAAEYQRDIIANWNSALDVEQRAGRDQGPARRTTARTADVGEGSRRTATRSRARSRRPRSSSASTATNIHGEAQRREKSLKLPKPTAA